MPSKRLIVDVFRSLSFSDATERRQLSAAIAEGKGQSSLVNYWSVPRMLQSACLVFNRVLQIATPLSDVGGDRGRFLN